MEEDQAPRMTLRVSRDGGRTYGEPVNVWLRNLGDPIKDTLVWPPCQCPEHVRKERP